MQSQFEGEPVRSTERPTGTIERYFNSAVIADVGVGRLIHYICEPDPIPPVPSSQIDWGQKERQWSSFENHSEAHGLLYKQITRIKEEDVRQLHAVIDYIVKDTQSQKHPFLRLRNTDLSLLGKYRATVILPEESIIPKGPLYGRLHPLIVQKIPNEGKIGRFRGDRFLLGSVHSGESIEIPEAFDIDILLFTRNDRESHLADARYDYVRAYSNFRYQDRKFKTLKEVEQFLKQIEASQGQVFSMEVPKPEEVIPRLLPALKKAWGRASSPAASFLAKSINEYEAALSEIDPGKREALILQATVPLWVAIRSGELWQALVKDGCRYCLPKLDQDGTSLVIKNGMPLSLVLADMHVDDYDYAHRGKRIERYSKERRTIVPNDVELKSGEPLVYLSSNGAGKSTEQRKIAAAVISAGIGQPVIADSMQLPPIENVAQNTFTEDDWKQATEGDTSHFRIEMTKLAQILNETDTANRLVNLEDFGLTVETIDGLSICLAVMEEAQNKHIQYLTISTHLSDLTALCEKLGIPAKFVVMDPETHKARDLNSGEKVESGAIAMAKKMGMNREVIAVARQLQTQEVADSIHLELPEITSHEFDRQSTVFNHMDEITLQQLLAEFHGLLWIENEGRRVKYYIKESISDRFYYLNEFNLFPNQPHNAAIEFFSNTIGRFLTSDYDRADIGDRRTLVERLKASSPDSLYEPVRFLLDKFIYPEYVTEDYLFSIGEPVYQSPLGHMGYVNQQKFFGARIDRSSEYVDYVRTFLPQIRQLRESMANSYLDSDLEALEDLAQNQHLVELNNNIDRLLKIKPKKPDDEPPENLSGKALADWREAYKKKKEEYDTQLALWKEQINPLAQEQEKIVDAYYDSISNIYGWLAISQIVDRSPNSISQDTESKMFFRDGYNFDLLCHKNTDEITPNSVPMPTDENPVIILYGQAGGGKTRTLQSIPYHIRIENITGHGLAKESFASKFRYVVSRIDPVFQSDKESSYQAEIVQRANDIIARAMEGGPGGLFLWDAPLEKYTSHEEAKYIIAATLLYLQRLGCYAVITSHVTELEDLLIKLDTESRLRYLPYHVTDPYGDNPHQVLAGKGKSYGIETLARIPGFPPQIIERAKYFRDRILAEGN